MPFHDHPYVAAAVTTAGLVGTAYAGYKLYQSKYPALPTEWKQVGTLSDLYVYPIKSVAPVIVSSAEATVMGLRQGWLRDRVLMVVDEKDNFITARAYPQLLTVHPSVKNSILTLEHADMNILKVNLAEIIESGIEPKTAYVWGVPVPVYDCGFDANEWFSRLLDRSVSKYRLVYYASHKPRQLRANNAFYKFTKNDVGAFPDEFAYNLINEASVKELNTRLKECSVTHRNFRPNFVLRGAGAFDEDNWKFVKIGDNVFEIIKPCTRCVLTTIDPETGVRNNKSEPLETLKSYRKIVDPVERKAAGNSPRMGLQMALRSGPGGVISLNDPIYVA